MKKLLIVFDDETANLLQDYPNMSQVVRNATQLYIGHILPDTAEGLRASYKIVTKLLLELKLQQKELDSKVDYIAGKLN